MSLGQKGLRDGHSSIDCSPLELAVERFTVVLTDGSIIQATRDNEHSDLFRALKGELACLP